MPPFYAQHMLAQHLLPLCVRCAVEGGDDHIDVTATLSEDTSRRCVKLLNLGAGSRAASIVFSDGWIGSPPIVTVLTGRLDAENTPEEPERVAPVVEDHRWQAEPFRLELPPYSFTAVRFG
jgi:alpha-L-arabinofuranosidase